MALNLIMVHIQGNLVSVPPRPQGRWSGLPREGMYAPGRGAISGRGQEFVPPLRSDAGVNLRGARSETSLNQPPAAVGSSSMGAQGLLSGGGPETDR